jgi:hypothetical protein
MPAIRLTELGVSVGWLEGVEGVGVPVGVGVGVGVGVDGVPVGVGVGVGVALGVGAPGAALGAGVGALGAGVGALGAGGMSTCRSGLDGRVGWPAQWGRRKTQQVVVGAAGRRCVAVRASPHRR